MGANRDLRAFGVVSTALLLATALVVSIDVAGAPAAHGQTGNLIDFEEAIFSPGNVTVQYCDLGVEFMEPVRVIEPVSGTSTPTHAVTNHFTGDEFTENRIMEISFTAPQSEVSVDAGLEHSYAYPLTAALRAYDTPDPDAGGLIAWDFQVLGPGPTPITQTLSVTAPGGTSIRSVQIEFLDPGSGLGAHEVIDDLSFSTVGPGCGEDTWSPIVFIIEPSALDVFYTPPDGGPLPMNLVFVAGDAGTGLAQIEVSFNTWNPVLIRVETIESFNVCGGDAAPCPTPGHAFTADFVTAIPPGTEVIMVEAWDYTNRSGRDLVAVTAEPSSVNLWARGLEITQAIQDWVATPAATRSDDIPLFSYPAPPDGVKMAAGRTTIARLMVGVEGLPSGETSVKGVGATLQCFIHGSLNAPCPGPLLAEPLADPFKGSASRIAVTESHTLDDQRGDAGLTLNFVLPAEWTAQGKVDLRANVTWGMPECSGCDDWANSVEVVGIRFWPVKPWNDAVRNVLLDRLGQGTATQAEREASLDFIRRTYPVDESTVTDLWYFTSFFSLTFPGLPDPGLQLCEDALDALESRWGYLIDDYGYVAISALTDSNPPGFCPGLGRVGVAVSHPGSAETMAHETGHGAGLKHPGPVGEGHGDECKLDRYCEEEWPWPHGGIGGWGFNIDTFEALEPGAPPGGHQHDFMSYGTPEWVSPRNWNRLIDKFGLPIPFPTLAGSTSAAASEPEGASVASPHLLVRAATDRRTGMWTISPVYAADRVSSDLEPPTSGDLLLRLEDESGESVTSRWITVAAGHIDGFDETSLESATPAFVVWLEVAPADVHRVVLVDGAIELADRVRSPSSPIVDLLHPIDGVFEGTVSWQWADEDLDDLEGLVEYRSGPTAEWLPIAVGVRNTSIPVDPASLPGGIAAEFRVTVSDGMNTTQVISEPVAIGDHAPMVTILAPSDGLTVPAGGRVEFRAAVSDLEDGGLAGNAISWTSDRDGLLGHGSKVGAALVAPGSHTVTVRATDSTGNSSASTITLEVLESEVRNTQPVADAGPDQVLGVGGTASLDGSGSFDADGDQLRFLWKVASKPIGASAWLSDEGVPQPTLFAGQSGLYVVQLVVHDGQVGSVVDEVEIIRDVDAPTAWITTSPPSPNGEAGWFVTPVIVTVDADDDGGSGIAAVEYRVNAGSWIPYLGSFSLDISGEHEIEARAIDIAGNVQDPPESVTLRIDLNAPDLVIVTPPPGSAVQDGLTVAADAPDDASGTLAVLFSIRAADGGQGIPLGLEDIAATQLPATDRWGFEFDSTTLPDGHYVVFAYAADSAGNTVSAGPELFSIRNWAVIELLPASPEYRAGRTVPIKFRLQVAEAVDPAMPFVYNGELTIVISRNGAVEQTSTFGDQSTDYRIDAVGEHYITNFKTDKRPAEYVVDVWRGDLLIGSFEFETSRRVR